jgi:DNA polymerase III subunit beta
LKLVASRQTLLSELQTVARATAVRGAIQTLTGILISPKEDRVELAATDTEIGLRSHVEAAIESPGSALVPGRLMVDILRALSGDQVTLEHKPDRNEVEVTSEQARFVVRSLPSEDFPRLPELSAAGSVTVPGKPFARTVERVARAASRDETRPVLTGILVSVEGRELKMVATDSYRLSVKETLLEGEAESGFEANVPARALRELSRIVGDVDAGEVTASAQDNQIVFGIDRVTLSSRMIDGQFPNYRQLLPESYEHEVSVERDEFLAVVRRVSLMAQRNAPLRLRFEDGAVTMSAQTPDIGEAAETLPVNYSGEPLEIGFNPQFLQDGLESVEADGLALKLISPLRPGLIEAGDSGSGEEGRFLYLIMPVRLNV